MQIDILYSKNNAAHLQAASFVKKAVSTLGISAVINERSRLPGLASESLRWRWRILFTADDAYQG